MDFLSANNSCGQILLSLVSRGNAIIAELLRLRSAVPDIYRHKPPIHVEKVIRDFSYFDNAEFYDNEIANSSELYKLDLLIKETYQEILTRFYFAFESIHTYITDLNKYLEELEQGLFIQQNIESVLQCTDGKQLLIESAYLYGVMLFVLDAHIEGVVRERLLISYIRFNGTKHSSNIDDVCSLLRSTNYSPSKRPSPNYPCDLFSRVPISSPGFISRLLARLRSDDVYLQMSFYPLPQHGTVSLSTQASALVVILFFEMETLRNETAKMRQFVDKYFHDNWVVNIYMGEIVNLVDVWYCFPAAYKALTNTIHSDNVKKQASLHGGQVKPLISDLYGYLSSGVLTEEVVRNRTNDLLNLTRASNVSMRWTMLHSAACKTFSDSSKKCRQLHTLVTSSMKITHDDLLILLIASSHFEFKFKEIVTRMLQEKSEKWSNLIADCVSKSKELSAIFNGDYVLLTVKKNDNLRKWFSDISEKIDNLKHEEEMSTGRKIVQLIQALEQVQEFHQLDTQIQVHEHLESIRGSLGVLLRVIQVNEDVLVTIGNVGDLAYACTLIDSYTTAMQAAISSRPKLVVQLRTVFLKLASAMEVPLMRINQSQSNDLLSVSGYYSSELVDYFTRVLQVIPQSMFKLLSSLIEIQTNSLKELPMRLNKDQLKEYAQLDQRFQISGLTHSISMFTEGIIEMDSTLVGIIKIDPKLLLEEGIRRELVKHISLTLHESLIFTQKANDLGNKLNSVGLKMDGFKRSFEYIQDYINICGLRVWQEELSRIINFNIEHECNSFLHNKINLFESIYQSDNIPIPVYTKVDKSSCNFIGRLAREIMRITDPKSTQFVSHINAWYEVKTKTQVLTTAIFNKIETCIGTLCLSGLYNLYGFMIVHLLQKYFSSVLMILKDSQALNQFLDQLSSANTPLASKVYSQLFSRYQLSQFHGTVLKIGQMQILREAIGEKLEILAGNNSTDLYKSLLRVNIHIMADVSRSIGDSSTPAAPPPLPPPHNHDLAYFTQYLDAVGIDDVFRKIYTTNKRIKMVALFNFILTASNFAKFQYSTNYGELNYSGLDGATYTVGMATIQNQCHIKDTKLYTDYICQYACSLASVGGKQFNGELKNCLIFLKRFLKNTSIKVESLEIPNFLLETTNV